MALLLLLGEGAFNRQVRNLLNEQSGNFINGELKIGEIKGRLFRELILEDVLLKESDDTMLYVKNVSFRYDLASILRKQILLQDVQIQTARINLEQDSDSIWNFMKILPDSNSRKEEDKNPSPFSWIIQADKIQLHDCTASIHPVDFATILPRMITAHADLSIQWNPEGAFLEMKKFEVSMQKPDFSIGKMSFLVELSDHEITVSDLQMRFTGGELYGDARIDLNEIIQSSARIEIPSLELQNLPDFLKVPDIQASPTVSLKLDNQKAEFILMEGIQMVAIQGWISGLDSLADYSATGNFKNINLSVWTNQKEMASDFSGNFGIKGQGIDVLSNRMEIDFSLLRTRFMDHVLSLHASLKKESDRLNGKVDVFSDVGQLSSYLQAYDIFKKVGVNTQMKLRNVDLSKILSDSIYQTSVNADLTLAASNILEPENMKLNMRFVSSENQWRDHPAGNIELEGSYDRGNYFIKEAEIQAPWLNLNLTGHSSIDGGHQLEYGLLILDSNTLSRLAGFDSLHVTGKTSGRLTGSKANLHWDQEISLSDFWFNGIKFDSLNANSELRYTKDTITGYLSAQLESLQTDSLTVESINLYSKADGESIHNQLEVKVNNDLRSKMTASVVPGNDIKVIVPHIELIYKDIDWLGYTDTLSYNSQTHFMEIPKITFKSGLQSIHISGHLYDTLSVGMDVTLDNLDLGALPIDSLVSHEISGTIDGYFNMFGIPQQPKFSSQFQVTGFQLDTLRLDSIVMQAAYAEEQLDIDAAVSAYNQRLLRVRGQIPLILSLTDSVALLQNDNSFELEADVLVNRLSDFSSFIPPGIMVDGSGGMKLSVGNTIADPDFTGSVSLSDGIVKYPSYGVNYRDIKFYGQFDQKHLSFDTVRVESGNGHLLISGRIGFTGLDSLGIQSIDLDLRSNRFTVTNGPQAEIVFSSKFNLTGQPDAARFSGNMTIDRGLIHLDALMAQFGMVTDDPNPPLLIQELESAHALPSDSVSVETGETIFNEVDFIKNLRGEFDINIPGNTWVRGKDINMELSGNLKAIKEGVQTDLFGTLEVRRGHYVVYGKRLEVETGQIELTGGSEINPLLNVEVAYSFRDRDKQLRKLTLNVTGRALQPEIQFYLDGSLIEEKDGMAYLVFGRSMDELTQGEQSSVDYNMSDLGKSLALGQLSGLVQGALQSSLGLDVVDISGDDNWTTGNVTLGKYLTKNLFLSYSRNFAFDKKNKIAHPDEVILEYQIFKWLYLQAISQGANNGFDLIIQKKWK